MGVRLVEASASSFGSNRATWNITGLVVAGTPGLRPGGDPVRGPRRSVGAAAIAAGSPATNTPPHRECPKWMNMQTPTGELGTRVTSRCRSCLRCRILSQEIREALALFSRS